MGKLFDFKKASNLFMTPLVSDIAIFTTDYMKHIEMKKKLYKLKGRFN